MGPFGSTPILVKCEQGRGECEGQPFLLFSFSCIYRSKDMRKSSTCEEQNWRFGKSVSPVGKSVISVKK
jgi:hypothetical protein